MRSKSKLLFVVLSLILAFVVGFRGDSIGTDTHTYNAYYETLYFGGGYMELGWNYLSAIFRFLNVPSYIFNAIIAALSFLIMGCVIWRHEEYRLASIFVFYSVGLYFFMFNGMRQSFAMSICLLGMHFYVEKKNLLFIITILLASLFHYSSLLVLILYFFKINKLIGRKIYALLILSAIVGLIVPVDSLAIFSDKYAEKLTSTGVRDNILSLVVYLVFMNSFFIYLWYRSKENKEKDPWLNVFLLSMILFNIFVKSNLALRAVFYLSIAQIICLPKFMKVSKSANIIILGYCLLNFVRYLIPEYLNWGVDGSLVPFEFNVDFLKSLKHISLF